MTTQRTKRSSRETYNTYYREYMQRYRAGGVATKPHSNATRAIPQHHDEVLRVLRRRRLNLGLEQDELSEMAGLTRSALSRYENMRQDPGFSKVQAWIGALGGRIIIEWDYK